MARRVANVIVLERPGPGGSLAIDTGPGHALAESRRHFERLHWTLIPQLVGPRLLDEITAELERAAFEARDYDGLAGELTLDHRVPLVARLLFMVNAPAVHRAVESATGIETLARFDGRIYRRMARPEHYDNWHDDATGASRLVAMSVNLGREPYGGGVLELREKGSTELLAAIHNTGPGDALLFRVRRDLQHRVTSITAGTKTALAGWFGAFPPWPTPVRKL